jgi:CRP-like cAMP-binding protein
MNVLKRDPIPIRPQLFRNNALLAALPMECYANLLPHLRSVYVEKGDILYDDLSREKYVYFPTTCMMSIMYDMVNGLSAEVAVIGREGLVGDTLLIGEGNNTSSRVVVQSAGGAFRIKFDVLKREFDKGGAMQDLLLLYTQAQITQICQTAACNRHHAIEQQFCRWLLLCLDRSPSNQLFMTHERIANNLGVRRESVTAAAGILQEENVLQYRRGIILVVDRHRLEAKACECYTVVRNEYDRLLPTNNLRDIEPERRTTRIRGISPFNRRLSEQSRLVIPVAINVAIKALKIRA